MSNADLTAADRVTGSMLGGLELPLLRRIARRMPVKVLPDHLTLLGLAGAGLCFAGYALTAVSPLYLWLASVGIALNWFGDSLDGTLARVRRIERSRYGFMVDHTADMASQMLIGFGLGTMPWVHFGVACIVLLSFLGFSVFSYIKMHSDGELTISYTGVGPTEVRCVLIILNTVLFWYRPSVLMTPWGFLSVIDLTLLGIAALGFAGLALTAWREIRRLARIEPR